MMIAPACSTSLSSLSRSMSFCQLWILWESLGPRPGSICSSLREAFRISSGVLKTSKSCLTRTGPIPEMRFRAMKACLLSSMVNFLKVCFRL